MARSSHHQSSSSLNLWTLPLVNLTLAIGLLAYHVHAEAGAATIDLSLWNRITSGPEHLTTMDKIVFVVIITLAMSILNLLVKNSGGTLRYVILQYVDSMFVGGTDFVRPWPHHLEDCFIVSFFFLVSFLLFSMDELDTNSCPRKASGRAQFHR
jgi:hypothetical protein